MRIYRRPRFCCVDKVVSSSLPDDLGKQTPGAQGGGTDGVIIRPERYTRTGAEDVGTRISHRVNLCRVPRRFKTLTSGVRLPLRHVLRKRTRVGNASDQTDFRRVNKHERIQPTEGMNDKIHFPTTLRVVAPAHQPKIHPRTETGNPWKENMGKIIHGRRVLHIRPTDYTNLRWCISKEKGQNNSLGHKHHRASSADVKHVAAAAYGSGIKLQHLRIQNSPRHASAGDLLERLHGGKVLRLETGTRTAGADIRYANRSAKNRRQR
jgi:hypothetical protein